MEWQQLKIRVFSLAKGYFECEPLQVSKAQLFQKQETTTNNMVMGPLASHHPGRQSKTDSGCDCELQDWFTELVSIFLMQIVTPFSFIYIKKELKLIEMLHLHISLSSGPESECLIWSSINQVTSALLLDSILEKDKKKMSCLWEV